MAGGRNIEGICVDIDNNVTSLEKALKSVNKAISEAREEFCDVERLLRLDPTNTELPRKQELLKQKISVAREKMDALKTAQEQAKR